MSIHSDLYEEARDALDELFGDTSVPQSQTLESLENIVALIQTMIDALDDAQQSP